jgi:hypothetical protein
LDVLADGLTALPDIDSTKIKFDYNLESRPQGEKFHFAFVQPIKIKEAIFDINQQGGMMEFALNC